jgi:rod shape-determining protein MreD
MPQLRIAASLAIAILLQLSLRKVWEPLGFIDLPLVIVVYVALQREAWQALLTGTLAGLAVDAASGGVLGAGGFSKTLTAYLIFFAATRVNLENPLLRIPILAAAAALDGSIYVGLHRLLTQPLQAPFVQTIAYRVIGTTIIGTLVLLMLDNLLSDKARQRRQFADRRKVAKRTTGLGKRRS